MFRDRIAANRSALGTYQGNVGNVGDKAFTLECTVQGIVTVPSDPEQLKKMRHIKVVQGSINLIGSTNLADGLPELQDCGAIGVGAGYTGTHLSAPASLKFALGLTVDKASQLKTISGFDGLTKLQALRINANAALTEIGGFANLVNLPYLELDNNPKLATVKAFSQLASGTSFIVKNSPALLQFPSMPVLEKLDKELVLNKLAMLTAMALPALKTTPALKIDACPKLTDLAFPELGPVGILWMHELPSLTSLLGFTKLQVSGQVSVCLDAVSCTALGEFFTEHTAAKSPNGGIDCGAWVKCKP